MTKKSKERFFIGMTKEGKWEAFSTTKCKDKECMVNLPALALTHGYNKCDGEFISIEAAENQIKKNKERGSRSNLLNKVMRP